MIYIRGDTHGEECQFSEQAMPGESSWTADDILLIAGDFGFVFQRGKIDTFPNETNLTL
jgi:hypothetical protein